MKKILFLAAATAIALSSCSKNEVEVNPTDPTNAIGFGTYVGSATKATSKYFNDKSIFTVSAYFTEDTTFSTTEDVASFMDNQTVTYAAGENDTEGSWSYSPLKYWPNDTKDKVSFFAVSNNTSDAAAELSTSNNLPSFTVTTLSKNPTGTLNDILVASALNKGESKDAVELTFTHATAGIKIDANMNSQLFEYDGKTATTSTAVTINSVSIDYGKVDVTGGIFEFNTDNSSAVGTWSNATTPTANVVVTYDGADDATTGYDIDETAANTVDIVEAYIIPTSTEATVTVNYNVKTTDSKDNANNSDVNNTATFKITPSTLNTLYTYHILISLEGVTVKGSLGDWATTTTKEYEVIVENSTETTPKEKTAA